MGQLQDQFAGGRFTKLIFQWQCHQKILVVTDGALDFGSGSFGLSEFIDILKSDGHTVSTEHRNGSGPNLTIGGLFNFGTANPAISIQNYDQIWLFGFNTVALSVGELEVVANFMQSGGGVFATGDHEDLGAGMGANLPRVRQMRDWASVPMRGVYRHDTVIDPGADAVKQFDDQADNIPQRVYPTFFSNGGNPSTASTWNVHPVLQHPAGAVDYLPDHPHESECLAPVPSTGNVAGIEEWPRPVGGGLRLAPIVVAVSISAGRLITDRINKPPVKPKCFGAISAYDGDRAQVGRIVCDATWHHFVNINLNGSGATDPATGLPRTGLYTGGMPTPEYRKIQRYYCNTARWLAPRTRRNCWPVLKALLVRFNTGIAELQLPDTNPSWERLVQIGLEAESTLVHYWGPGDMEQTVADFLDLSGQTPTLSKLLRAQLDVSEDSGQQHGAPDLLPRKQMRRAYLGGIINFLATTFPDDDDRELANFVEKADEKTALSLIINATDSASKTINDYFEKSMKETSILLTAIKEKK